MKGNYISFSPSEEKVMAVLWNAEQPLRASEIASILEPQTGWRLTTVRTFLTRLEKKGAVSSAPRPDSNDSVNYYSPKLLEKDIRLAEGESCLKRFFNGNISGFIASFIETGRVTKDELRQIRHLIDDQIKSDEKKSRD